MTEHWLPIAGYEKLYEVSDVGRVRSLDRQSDQGLRKGRIRKPGEAGEGYIAVTLSKDGIVRAHYVHRLVLETFVGPCPVGMEGCHDPDPTRTNCRLDNLRWDTRKNNQHDKRSHGSMPLGEKHRGAKLTDAAVYEMRRLRSQTGISYRAIAEQFSVARATAYRACIGRHWSHL